MLRYFNTIPVFGPRFVVYRTSNSFCLKDWLVFRGTPLRRDSGLRAILYTSLKSAVVDWLN